MSKLDYHTCKRKIMSFCKENLSVLQVDFCVSVKRWRSDSEMVNVGQILDRTAFVWWIFDTCSTFYHSKHSRQIYYTFLIHMLPENDNNKPKPKMKVESLFFFNLQRSQRKCRASNKAIARICWVLSLVCINLPQNAAIQANPSPVLLLVSQINSSMWSILFSQ